MAEEKTITLNLRKESVKTPKWRRSKDILSILRRRVERMTRSDDVSIDPKINEKFWARGPKFPDKVLKLKIKKADDGKVTTELVE